MPAHRKRRRLKSGAAQAKKTGSKSGLSAFSRNVQGKMLRERRKRSRKTRLTDAKPKTIEKPEVRRPEARTPECIRNKHTGESLTIEDVISTRHRVTARRTWQETSRDEKNRILSELKTKFDLPEDPNAAIAIIDELYRRLNIWQP